MVATTANDGQITNTLDGMTLVAIAEGASIWKLAQLNIVFLGRTV